MSRRKILTRYFYEREPEIVAKELMGKRLIRKFDVMRACALVCQTEEIVNARTYCAKGSGMKSQKSWLD